MLDNLSVDSCARVMWAGCIQTEYTYVFVRKIDYHLSVIIVVNKEKTIDVRKH